MTDIVITLTIKAVKRGKRPVIVSAAPAGEMPLLLTGQFADRHALLDEAFRQLLTRKPKVVKVAAKKDATPAAQGEDAEAVTDEIDTEAKPDQLVRSDPLPAIEGDTEPDADTAADDETHELRQAELI